MTQKSLFDADLPYVRRTENEPPNRYLGQTFSKAPILAQVSSPESVEAGIENMPNRATQRQRVLDHLREWGPSTDEQLQDALGMEGSTERPRRVELVERGLVHKVGTAKTKSGRSAALWNVVR